MTTQSNDKAAASAATSTDEDFFAAIRLDVSLTDNIVGVKRVLNVVPIRKPGKTDFFRVHPDYFVDTYAVELKDEGEHYFCTPAIAQELVSFVEPVRLRYCVTRQGTPFVWPLKLPRDNRRSDAWRQSALDAAQIAESRWVRVAADMGLGAYQVFEAVAVLKDPVWPEEPAEKVMQIAVRGRIISETDHAVVRQLLGMA